MCVDNFFKLITQINYFDIVLGTSFNIYLSTIWQNNELFNMGPVYHFFSKTDLTFSGQFDGFQLQRIDVCRTSPKLIHSNAKSTALLHFSPQ